MFIKAAILYFCGMARYFLHLAYKGTNYHGWQKQPNANTIQELIEKGLTTLLKTKISVTGAGRTDTGVHSRNFYAHFDCNVQFSFTNEKIVYKLNCILPDDIVIFGLYNMPEDSHARFDAISREYKYYISFKKEVFRTDYCWQNFSEMDIDKMNKASNQLLNYTDFTSFSKLHTNVKTNICKIDYAKWEVNNNFIIFTIIADRFLRNMVRSIVGTLIDVGINKLTIKDFSELIDKKDRSEAGMSVPAKGLILENIKYPYKIG